MSEELVKQSIVWVLTDEELESVCQSWESSIQERPLTESDFTLPPKILAVDTEFMRSDTYYPIAGLLQINDGDKNYLIDPTKITDYYPLVEVFDNRNILKVFHSCSEDLEVFHHTIGCVPKPILDTQIAGAMCGNGFSMGFANMVSRVLAVDLPKTETRSDWLARPLSKSQVYYAALDVEYLYQLAQSLIEQLNSKARLSWALEDSQQAIDKFVETQKTEHCLSRIKSAWRLHSRELAFLDRIAVWRENYAQQNNIPRNRVMKDNVLVDIAKLLPTHISQLRNIDGMSERGIKKFGKKILAVVEEALDIKEEDLPVRMPGPLSGEEKTLAREIKTIISDIANQIDIPSEILLRRKELEKMARALVISECEVHTYLDGWRKTVLAEPIKQIVR